MTATNGRANGSALHNPNELVVPTVVPPAGMSQSTGPQFSTDQIKELVAQLRPWRRRAARRLGGRYLRVALRCAGRSHRLRNTFLPALGAEHEFVVSVSAAPAVNF